MRDIATIEEAEALAGSEVAVTDWILIDQARINQFADATNDHQWIHVDPERCKRESPFGGTVAHGFLTLSLISGLFDSAVRLTGAKMVLNYGLNKVRFPAPVPVDSRLRARIRLAKVDAIEGGMQLTWEVTMEVDGGAKPVCVAEFLIRRY